MASSGCMHVEQLEDIANAGADVAPTGVKPAVSRRLKIVFCIEAGLFVFVAAAAVKILLTPKRDLAAVQSTQTQLIWVDQSGRRIQSLDLSGRYTSPRSFFRNSSILLNKIEPSKSSMWSLSPEGLEIKPVIPVQRRTGFGVFAPSGKEIVFESWGDGVLRSTMNTGWFKPRRLGTDASGIPEDWSSDGRWIALTKRGGQPQELWLFDVATGCSTLFSKAKELSEPRFSPDSRWIAFTASFGGEEEIYRVALRGDACSSGGAGEPVRVSLDGGHSCRWADSANELFYVDGEQDMVAAHWSAGSAPARFRKMFNLKSIAMSGYEYRFDGFAFDRPRNAFVFALARAANWDEH